MNPTDSLDDERDTSTPTACGKTTALETTVGAIIRDPQEPACVFIVDPHNKLARDFLKLMRT